MADYCNGSLPSGVSANCLTFPKEVKNIIITSPTVTFTEDELINGLTKLEEVLKTNKTGYVPAGLTEYEDTTDDVTIITSGKGKKYFDNEGYPSAVMYLESNMCDFGMALRAFKSSTYRVMFILEDNSVMAYQNMNKPDEIKGFLCEVTANQVGIPSIDASQQAYRLYINAKDRNEFNSRYFNIPTWTDSDLTDLMPIGVGIYKPSTYSVANGNMTFQVIAPCRVQLKTLVVADIEIVSATIAGTAPVVALTLVNDASTGIYTLVLEDTVAAVLAVGDVVEFKVKSTDDTYNSESYTITVVA